jgi:C1A family cysteine protease
MIRVALCVLLLIAVASCASTTQQFIEWQHQHGKLYATAEEFQYRLSVFQDNLLKVQDKNAKAKNPVFGVTKFMDMTTEEFRTTVLLSKMPPKQDPTKGPYHFENFTSPAPTSFTWWGKGVTTPIYNQGQCGSCWAFSATEDIESQWAIAGKGLVSLSMQQIVSCDTTCYGCGGGWPYLAYAYVAEAGGIDTYASYPYTAETGTCSFNQATIAAKLNPSNSWTYVTQNENEGEMVNYLVAHGPLSICVDASSWQFYTSGVLLASDCTTSIDHCVDAVGYNLGANPSYWIVRNSWGTDWGLNGFIWLQYGQDTCAMAQVVTNALVA